MAINHALFYNDLFKLISRGKHMKKISLFVSLIALFVTGSAFGHGPVRAKMTATIVIDAPADKVWEVIKNYDDMSWHPAIESVACEEGNKKGSERVLTLKEGGTLTEVLKAYKGDKMSYKYKITEMSTSGTVHHAGQDEDIPVLPVANYAATISVKDKGGKSEVKWVATYYRAYVNNNPPEELNEEAADEAVKKVLISGLVNLAKKFDDKVSDSDVKIVIKR